MPRAEHPHRVKSVSMCLRRTSSPSTVFPQWNLFGLKTRERQSNLYQTGVLSSQRRVWVGGCCPLYNTGTAERIAIRLELGTLGNPRHTVLDDPPREGMGDSMRPSPNFSSHLYVYLHRRAEICHWMLRNVLHYGWHLAVRQGRCHDVSSSKVTHSTHMLVALCVHKPFRNRATAAALSVPYARWMTISHCATHTVIRQVYGVLRFSSRLFRAVTKTSFYCFQAAEMYETVTDCPSPSVTFFILGDIFILLKF